MKLPETVVALVVVWGLATNTVTSAEAWVRSDSTEGEDPNETDSVLAGFSGYSENTAGRMAATAQAVAAAQGSSARNIAYNASKISTEAAEAVALATEVQIDAANKASLALDRAIAEQKASERAQVLAAEAREAAEAGAVLSNAAAAAQTRAANQAALAKSLTDAQAVAAKQVEELAAVAAKASQEASEKAKIAANAEAKARQAIREAQKAFAKAQLAVKIALVERAALSGNREAQDRTDQEASSAAAGQAAAMETRTRAIAAARGSARTRKDGNGN